MEESDLKVAGGSVSVSTGGLRTDIDAALTVGGQTPPAVVTTPPSISVPPAATVVGKPALKCHRGFVKRKVRGKLRCVKRHRAPKHHRRPKKPSGHTS